MSHSRDSASSTDKLISLEELLSSCIDASIQGCDVIRKYKQSNATLTGELKEAGEIKSVVTQADIDAQNVIVNGLRQLWGDQLHIVGEEDDNEDPASSILSSLEPLRTNLLAADLSSKTLVPIQEVTLFVDPLDGTREFVEGRVQNVACLIGVARHGKSIMGAVGLPFPTGISSPNAKTLYAIHMDDDIAEISHQGTYPSTTTSSTAGKTGDDLGITVFTGDSNDPVLLNATQLALKLAASLDENKKEPIHALLGGTASKLVAVAQQERSIAVLHFKTCYWDTCSPQAVLNAMGGKITDMFGSPLVHKDDKRYDYGNRWGVVASASGMEAVHDALCARMRADFESVQKILEPCFGTIPGTTGAQAIDISRDIDGHPLTRTWLEEHILQHQEEGNKKWTLKGFAVPESDAVRGLMSNGARLVLDWASTDDAGSSNCKSPPSTVFYKRVVMSDLAHARAKLASAPHKVTRDVHSYQVETNFLDSRACQEGLIHEAGVHVCDCYGSSKEIPPNATSPRQQLESRFSMTLEDFNEKDGWYHEWLLEEKSCRAVLKALANMHAYFWTGSNFWKKEGGKVGQELEEVVWPNGGYMQPALQGYGQLEKVAVGWTNRLPTFKDDLSAVAELEGVDLEHLGARVEKLAKIVGTRAHPFAELAKKDTADLQKYRTMIHGDPKQANLFFRKGAEEELQVGFIDFQWCGFGLAATDVAHFISAALQPHCVSHDGQKEKELLDHYHASLADAFVKYGVASTVEDVETIFPRKLLQEQYEVAFLDVCRMVFAYAWARWKPESEPTAASFNRNAYNKSLKSVLWLITRCSAILDAKEKDLLA
ncbi:3'(2'),5'-bisphosphate nucleotidase 1 [Seminavis robusta]|uniref:3'(2'),5'-bisphosphate nucleotidase 1 n=1 Tax=Seminavis robusta TaxID=568900 RepID=A0A9N8EVI8_9STRA|nr:3'(2'),5'-bisphosphate nucleotidase 1 [Seminavis robusta]|eukprot:Sro2106_g314800.1 3'(2'),5'-bisphosphate nucleotidase 1 (827) ;mRNA; r:6848-9406